MLVITRKIGEKIYVGKNVTIQILRDGTHIRLGIEAPPDVQIRRDNAKRKGSPERTAARIQKRREQEPKT